MGTPSSWCVGWALAFAQGDAAAKPAPDAGKPPAVAVPEAKPPAPAGAKAPPAGAALPEGKAEPAPADAGIFGSMLPFAIMLAAAYFLLILPNQRNERKRKDLLSAIKKDDKVETSSGIVGIVANLDADFVTLKLDEKRDATMKVRRSAIAAVLKNA